jgi:hypothetical protein
MIAKAGSTPYRLNLIRAIREREKTRERRRRMAFILGAGCFGFFILSVLYSALTIWQMEHVLAIEKDKLSRIQQEYRKYTATKLIVDKSDVELLGSLQGQGMFWTRKLVALAQHLPDNYWITGFSYRDGELRVSGYGLAGPQQQQLLVLNGYMDQLQGDTAFSDVFKTVRLQSADRNPDGGKIAFAFSAYSSDRKPR